MKAPDCLEGILFAFPRLSRGHRRCNKCEVCCTVLDTIEMNDRSVPELRHLYPGQTEIGIGLPLLNKKAAPTWRPLLDL